MTSVPVEDASITWSGLGCFEVRDGTRVLAAHAEKQARKPPSKIDANGQYLRFPGIAVVCNLSSTTSFDLTAVIRAQPDLGKIMAPLPASSYHVTLLDVCCQYKLGLDASEWQMYCSHPRWAEAAAEARRSEFSPQLQIGRLDTWAGGMGLTLEAATNTPAHPGDVPLGRRIQAKLGVAGQRYPWHLTLAYCMDPTAYERLISTDPARLEAQRAAVEAAARRAVDGGLLSFCEARLCRFEDMTEFVPWDGDKSHPH